MKEQETSDWQGAIFAALEQRRKGTGTRGPGRYASAFSRALKPLNFHAAVEFVALMDRAASARGVNRSTFARRAIAVQIAHTLGIPVHEALWHTPAPGAHAHPPSHHGERDLGEGIETWCPHPACQGEHLRLL